MYRVYVTGFANVALLDGRKTQGGRTRLGYVRKCAYVCVLKMTLILCDCCCCCCGRCCVQLLSHEVIERTRERLKFNGV